MGISLDMLKGPRGIDLLSTHNNRIVESRNAKFLENDLISGSDKF